MPLLHRPSLLTPALTSPGSPGGLTPLLRLDFTTGVLDGSLTYGGGDNGTYFDSDGVLQVSGADEERFLREYDGSAWSVKGILLENTQTNTQVRSKEISNGVWTKQNGMAVTADQATAPDGTTTADELHASTTGNAQVWDRWGVTSNRYYGWSVYVRNKNSDKFSITNWGTPSGQSMLVVTATFESQTEGADIVSIDTSASVSLIDAGFENVGGGWWRLWGVSDTLAKTAYLTNLSLGAGDAGRKVYAWGAQFEPWTVETYVHTVASSVTRTVEHLTTTSIDWFDATEGTFVIGFRQLRPDTNSGYSGFIFSMDDGTANETLNIEVDQDTGISSLNCVDGGASQVALAIGAHAANTDHKIAVAYKANDFAASLDGAAVVTDTSGSLPTVTTLRLGVRYNNTSSLMGMMEDFEYYPTRLSNSDLVSLSA